MVEDFRTIETKFRTIEYNAEAMPVLHAGLDSYRLERMAPPNTTTTPPQFPLGSERWSVGANSHQCRRDGAVLARSGTGRRQGLAEQRCPGTSTSTPLPILAVAGWAVSLVHSEGPPVPGGMGQANCCCGSREALADAEPVLSADVRLTRGRKRSERRLLLLPEELVVAKLQRGTALRPQLRLALDQLWVLSGGKEAAGEEGEEEEEEGGGKDRTSLFLAWPTGSCLATFGSRAAKELWVGTLLGQPEGARRARVTQLPSIQFLEKELSRHHAWRTLSARSLETLLEGQAEELLAVLHQEGPSTEGIFRRAASGTSLRELREALDHGADIDLGSQPALLLAIILKDFLRSIPAKLLVTHLYEDWMTALGRTSKQEKVEELKAHWLPPALCKPGGWLWATSALLALCSCSLRVADKLPAANLLLLKRLLSLLQHIGHNASTSRMSCSNLAICVGPNLLSPANEDLLPLEAMLEVTQKVNVLVEFLIENCCELFGEEMAGLSSASAEESPAPMGRCTDLSTEEQSGPAVKADTEHHAKAVLDAPPGLLGVLKEAGGDKVVMSETGEVPIHFLWLNRCEFWAPTLDDQNKMTFCVF
ncbi:hypothetical protein QYF61_013852 [Mycteria americana]|uniref:Rho-GAP domain-containing protein n=1 Tax=Mycteria americana TaxID=33587 RepID=A0AAN7RJJ1_MYCAM|nr:hypothetical protein QYF61_013852 [Mycteria americana]